MTLFKSKLRRYHKPIVRTITVLVRCVLFNDNVALNLIRIAYIRSLYAWSIFGTCVFYPKRVNRPRLYDDIRVHVMPSDINRNYHIIVPDFLHYMFPDSFKNCILSNVNWNYRIMALDFSELGELCYGH